MKKLALLSCLLLAHSAFAQWDVNGLQPTRTRDLPWAYWDGDVYPLPVQQERTSADIPKPNDAFTNLLRTADPAADAWNGLRYDPGRVKLTREPLVELAKVQSNLDMADPREMREKPWRPGDWRAEESLSLPLPATDKLFVFGKFDSTGETHDSRRLRMTGKSGFGLKWSPFEKSELQFRSGPVVNISDVYNPVRAQEKSQLSVELQAKLALFGPLQLQYSGEALPALIQTDRHQVLQDLKLAVPFGNNREFHFGAKYRWEDLSASPWHDRTQLYMGLKFEH